MAQFHQTFLTNPSKLRIYLCKISTESEITETVKQALVCVFMLSAEFHSISDFYFKVAWFWRHETVGGMVFHFPFDSFKFRLVFVFLIFELFCYNEEYKTLYNQSNIYCGSN